MTRALEEAVEVATKMTTLATPDQREQRIDDLFRDEAVATLAREARAYMENADKLARALLAIAPLATAALKLYDRAEKCHDRAYLGCAMTHDTIESALGDEVEHARSALGKGDGNG